MKKLMKRIGAVLMAVAMMAALGVSAWAAPDPVPTKGTITINNAGIGETYSAYKVLTAKVGANGAIVYPGPVPTDLADCFEVAEDGVNLKVKDGLTETALFEKLKTWAASQTADYTKKATTSTVVFDDVAFGYYVIVSTMDNGSVISVTSTDPNAVTYEKNTTVPQPEKTVDDTAYSIGDTITYTVTFPGANYMQEDKTGENSRIVTKYEVSDTLPEFLSDATITSIKIGDTTYSGDTLNTTNFPGVTTFGTTKKFEIPWATKGAGAHDWTSKYANGTEVTITYTAKLTSVVNVNANNTNTVTVQPYVDKPDKDQPEPWDEKWDDDAVVTTYAAALKKVDGSDKTLAGAKFKFNGLSVTKTADGIYTVVSYDPTSSTPGDEMEVGADGMLYIIGLDNKADDEDTNPVTLTGKETEAPDGYNLLADDVTLSAQVLSKEVYKASGTRKYDAKGNLIESTATAKTTKEVEKNLNELDAAAVKVVNQAGSTLPSTGGIGTYVFTVAGVAIMAIAAGLLIVRHKKKAE